MPGLNVGPRSGARTLSGGLFRVADVVDTQDRIIGGVDADPMVCDLPSFGTGYCFTADDAVEKDKVGFSAFTEDPANGVGFYTYLALECFLNADSLAGEAEQAYDWGEERAVGEAFFTHILSALTLDATSATSIEGALGAAENVSRDMLMGGVLLMTPSTATSLGSHLRYDGDGNLFTRQGTPISTALPSGTAGIYVTGPITLYQGSKAVHAVPDPVTNRELVLVERPWSGLVDCGGTVITVTEDA